MSYDRTANTDTALDLNDLSWKALAAIRALDEKFIGTPDYMGLAFFWNSEYKWELRGASPARRQKVHAALLKAGLPLDEQSPEHYSVILGALR